MAIKLGGSSTSQINEVVTLNNDASTVTLADGRVYLKGGVLETNLATYPNAFSGYKHVGGFSVAGQMAVPTDMTWDGTHFWVVENVSDVVYKYTSAGVYTGTSFSVAGQEASPQGITWDGTSLWVVGLVTDAAYNYRIVNGVASDTSLTASGAQNYVRVV